jgi:hypothetical protein
MRNKQELEEYLDGCAKDLNAPPSVRKAAKPGAKAGAKVKAGS